MVRRCLRIAAALCMSAPVAAQEPQSPSGLATVGIVDPATSAKLQALRQLLDQRDQLQRQIDQLIIETQTPQQMIVRLELLEIDVTAAQSLRAKNQEARSNVDAAGGSGWTSREIDLLRQKGIAKSLETPELMAVTGQAATSRSGGDRATSLEVQLRPDSLGANQVHLQLFVERTTADDSASSEPNRPNVPSKISFTTALDLAFGETRVLSGMISKRTQTRRGALGRVTQEIVTEPVLLVRVEGITPRTAGIVPVSAIAPR